MGVNTLPRFSHFAQKFLEERRADKPASVRSWTSILKHHLLPKFGHTPLNQISEYDIREFVSILKSAKRTNRTINNILQPLRAILAQSQRAGLLERNPALYVSSLKIDKPKIAPLTPTELAAVLEALPEHWKPFFTVLAYTGMRPCEALGLRWEDVDFSSGSISITQARVRGKTGVPKTPESVRSVPMIGPVRGVLSELQKERHYVFVNFRGRPINGHLDHVWRNTLAKAGIMHRPSYQLRHTFATYLIEQGLPITYVAKLLGHADIDVTIRNYVGYLDNKENEKKLRELFSGQEGVPQKDLNVKKCQEPGRLTRSRKPMEIRGLSIAEF